MAIGTRARGPRDLSTLPLRGKNLTEDTRNWTDAAHGICRDLALEMHAFAILLARKMKLAAKGGLVEKFQVGSAARKATRPLLRAASQADGAANGVHRFWRAYLSAASELEMARRAAGSRRRTR